jgi:transposase
MSLHPQPIAPIPAETARVARAAFPRGNPYMRLRDELGVFYQDEAFAALFPTRGQPAASPWRLALVLVLQYAEGLSDRQAADAVRSRIDWKYALSLELTDSGFDASVLSEFRSRLVAGSQEQLLLDAMLTCFQAKGLLKARGRQRTDSTAVVAAIRTLNRLECIGETLRHALNRLAVAAPEWLGPHLDPTWAERYGPRCDEYRLPKGDAARQTLAEQIGRDGFRLLAAVYAPEAPAALRTLPAVEALRQVWLQQFYAPEPDGTTHWRSPRDLPPAARMLNSPHDREARYAYKRSTAWIGYKVHLTETCDPDAPHLITQVETTVAPTPDRDPLPRIHQALARKDLLPREHLVDAGYVDAARLARRQQDHGVALIGPAPPDSAWQARRGAGFDGAGFAIDWDRRTATCPAGQTSAPAATRRDRFGHEQTYFQFARQACQACAQRTACTTAPAGRRLTVRAKDEHLALQAARQFQTTPAFKAQYDARAGVEGTLSQGLRVCALRRARYIGLAKTHLQHVLTAAALNVLRSAHWLDDPRLARTRSAPFLALLPQAG